MSDAQRLQVNCSLPFKAGNIKGCPSLLIIERRHVVTDLGYVGESLDVEQTT